MPTSRSKFSYQRFDSKDSSSVVEKRSRNTWKRTPQDQTTVVAEKAGTEKGLPHQPSIALPGTTDLSSASLTASVRAPNANGGLNTQLHQFRSGLRPSVYSKSQPHQLRRLATPRSGLAARSEPPQTKVQTNFHRPVHPLPESQPQGCNGPSPGPLVHKSRHSLVRRSSGSILSAVAKTVAAVSTNSALRASKRWSRSGRDSNVSGASNHGSMPKVRATSRQPILTRPRISAKMAGRKEAFQWQRGQTGLSSGSKSSAQRLASTRTATLSHRPYKQLQGTKVGQAGPAKLVRVGGLLYRVSGIGKGRSLKRQVTPKSLPRPSLLSQPSKYQRLGNSLRRFSLTTPLAAPPSSRSERLQRLSRGTSARRLSAQNIAPRATAKATPLRLGVVSRIRKSTKYLNQVCYTFCRTGKCASREAGTCPLAHDPDKVAVCTKWLQGRCDTPACPLQHKLKPQLMPLCEHFIKGMCNKLDCPYLHVLLEEKAPICREFAKGYCPKGASCLKKHLSSRQVATVKASKSLTLTRKAAEIQEAPPKKRRRWPLPPEEEVPTDLAIEEAYQE